MRRRPRVLLSESRTTRRRLTEAQIDLTDDEIWGRSDFDLRKANKRSQDAEKARIKAQRDAEIFERNKQSAKKYFDIMESQNASDALDSLFELLVPRSGKAETVAGEIIRAVAKIKYRCYNDGDFWLFGYGVETCGKAISYLMENCDSVDEFLDNWYREWDEDGDSILYDYLYNYDTFKKKYESKLEQLCGKVIKWLLKHPEAFTTANDSDMLQYEVAYDELTFTYDHVLDNDLMILCDDGYITEDEIIDELFGWKYYNSEPYIEMSEVYIDNATIDNIEDIREVMDATEDGHTVYKQWIKDNGNPYDEDDEEEDEDDEDAEEMGILHEKMDSASNEIDESRFDVNQLAQIRNGEDSSVDVSIYADPKFDFLQMREIREGLESDVDVSIYANPKFTWEQMHQIRAGLESRVDVNMYADPKFLWWQMEKIRKFLECGEEGQAKRVITRGF